MSKLDTSIFRTYDIRGVYPDQLNEKVAYKIGRGYATLMQRENPDKKLEIIVSRDMRPSSPTLKKNLIQGLIESGVDVVDIDLNTTPTFYFAVAYFNYNGGVQITASHNPPEYNGLKMVRAQAKPLASGTGMEELAEIVKQEDFIQAQETGKIIEKTDVLETEIQEILKEIDIKSIKPYKIVVDAANSVGALDMKAIFEHLPCELVPLYFELNGTFPNHEADPLKPENLVDLKEKVKADKADLGIALDGDGDRMFFIDEKGEEVPQSILRGLMAQIELKKQPGATVCYDIRPGRATTDMIEEAGGKAVITRVGHSLIKAKMEEVGAIFGGESSGHYFYKFEYGIFDSALVLLTKFLEYISQQNKPVSEIIQPYKRYYHSGEINSMVEDKKAAIKRLADKYSDADISYLDGITVSYDDFWFNVRPSNTEPKLRLNLEAKTPELMEQKRDEVLTIIRQ
jgi:phosphomannomutase